MKTCIKCNESKSLDCFGKNNRNADGKQNVCKKCINSSRKDEYALNKDRILASNKKYRQSNKGKSKRSVYQKNWKKDNPEKHEARLKRFRLSDEEKSINRDKRKLESEFKRKARDDKRRQQIAKILDEYQSKLSNDLPQEMYSEVKGFEGRYMISNYGRVLSLVRGKLLKQILSDYGYLKVTLYNEDNKYGKKFLVHRLVADSFLSNEKGYEQINHMDFNKQNNVVTNLEWCTHQQNQRHRRAYETIKV